MAFKVGRIMKFKQASLTVAVPAQNVWYDVLPAVQGQIYVAMVFVTIASAETVEVRCTMDGNIWSGSSVMAAGASNWWYVGGNNVLAIEADVNRRGFNYTGGEFCGSLRVQVRQTTDPAASGALISRVTYSHG